MELLFDVYVESQKVHTGVTQDMFFDIVEDLSDLLQDRFSQLGDYLSHLLSQTHR